ncbi:MAG TPA: methyltransferase domain-containing protein [Gemmatimonadaceae bacterium]|nr:methyltransferase domain-containing protein [Gemmatimonadaceae bacterium]
MRTTALEILDDPEVDPALRERSHRDVERSNVLLGGRRAVMLTLRPLFDDLRNAGVARATLLDIGTGLADLPWRAREIARRRGIMLETIALDGAFTLISAARHRVNAPICGNALSLPVADHSVDFVLCSQLLHHFDEQSGAGLITELDRVARRRVIISDLRRSWVAALGWTFAAFALGFHPITRHDGRLSVLRGFTEGELGGMVVAATGVQPAIRRRLGYRLTASWTPSTITASRG